MEFRSRNIGFFFIIEKHWLFGRTGVKREKEGKVDG